VRIVIVPEREWQSIAPLVVVNRAHPWVHIGSLAVLPPLGAMAAGYYVCYLGLPLLAGVPRADASVCIGAAIIVSLICTRILGYVTGAVSDVTGWAR
jgi:hypothetical protein